MRDGMMACRRGVIQIALGLALSLAFAPCASAESPSKISGIADGVAKKWPELTHVAPGVVDDMIKADASGVVLFDVRTPKEYAISHLPGAIRVDPDMAKDAFLAAHGSALKDKTAVFYCGVGVRSSTFEARIGKDALKGAGAKASYNMAGGIMAWRADERTLVDAKGPTNAVDGYDASWGRLSKSQSLTRPSSPEPKSAE